MLDSFWKGRRKKFHNSTSNILDSFFQRRNDFTSLIGLSENTNKVGQDASSHFILEEKFHHSTLQLPRDSFFKGRASSSKGQKTNAISCDIKRHIACPFVPCGRHYYLGTCVCIELGK